MTPERERAEIEARIRATITQNQDVLRAVPKEASDHEYWAALRREGQPVLLHVRRLDSDTTDEQPDMYLIDEEEGQIEVTYFRYGDEVGESFWVALDRIISAA
ncbi:MAG: hypothetical protein UX17_C0062G0007 [Parcubacteria group bacterium GW2011_GWC2_45_7]|nr:MAG: hypothetical protein UX17_C0062G0007 [Parcubacteria group bacterium GW2011_GWC2_45_7]KKU73975.1 MAG: hypothetical protein UX98_C0002G0005 [Parcubacteria group bacterium GW2011_GWA2_47_26]